MKIYLATALIVLASFVFGHLNFETLSSGYTVEDGLIESSGAFFFLLASLVFLYSYRKTQPRNLFLLGMALVLFLGFGEEISWGQRIFNIETPESVKEINIQEEINLHNLEIFHRRARGGEKTGLALLLSIEMLFNLFWFTLFIALPLLNRYVPFIQKLVTRLRFPVGTLPIGALFVFTYIVFKTSVVVTEGHPSKYNPAAEFGELKEMFYALYFFYYALNQQSQLLASK